MSTAEPRDTWDRYDPCPICGHDVFVQVVRRYEKLYTNGDGAVQQVEVDDHMEAVEIRCLDCQAVLDREHRQTTLADLQSMAERRESISMVEPDTRNGRDVVRLRASRHAFPEDVLGRVNDHGTSLAGVYAVLRDRVTDEYLTPSTVEEFEPVPVLVVQEAA